MISSAHIARLPERGVLSVSGPDAAAFLDNLITNDMGLLDRQPALFAGLLTPQGKILFELFVVRAADGFLIDTPAGSAGDLLKRLSLYRLRAKVTLNDLSQSRAVLAVWGGPPPDLPLALAYPDPRHEGLGHRLIVPPEISVKLAAEDEGPDAYRRHRLRLGVPEAGLDYAPGDAFPHEANFDRLAGVSFTKGCFVGQEVVARMQHKTVVRKRIVRVTGSAALSEGADVLLGTAAIGRIGTADGREALALLRLDRASEALGRGQSLTAGGASLAVDAASLEAYRRAAAARSTEAS